MKAFLGLQWQKWAAILGSVAGALIVFYAFKSCLPCWGWAIGIALGLWRLLKYLFGCCCCLVRMLPRSEPPEAIRNEEVGHHSLRGQPSKCSVVQASLTSRAARVLTLQAIESCHTVH